MALTRAEIAARYRARHPDRVKAAKISAKERDRKWREANRERLLALGRKSYAKHREAISERRKVAYDPEKKKQRSRADYIKDRERKLEKGREWRRANPEKAFALARQWREKNRIRYLARSAYYAATRRAQVLRATPAWANTFFIREIYDLCQLRTEHLGIAHDVDHIIPLCAKTASGLHVHENLRVIPAVENRKKNNSFHGERDSLSPQRT